MNQLVRCIHALNVSFARISIFQRIFPNSLFLNHRFPALFQTRHRIVSCVKSNKLNPTSLKTSINRANRRANYLFISLLHYVRTKIFPVFYLIRISFEVSWSSGNARILTLVLVYCRSYTILRGQILITRSGFSLHCFYCKLKHITIITYTSNQNMIPPCIGIDTKSDLAKR